MENLYPTTLKQYIYNSIPHQTIFTVVKPGSLNYTQKIIELFKKHGWKIQQIKTKLLLLSEAKELYKMHKNEDFYKDLCAYMASGPSTAILFIRPGHQNPGTFKNVAKLKEEIRKKYGESEMRNVLHSSDSQENMEHEASIYFNI